MSRQTRNLVLISFTVIIVIISCFQFNGSSAAGPWYVKPGGVDTNDCLSPATACETINGALGKASSGDTIYVAEGTYTSTDTEVVLISQDATVSGGWDLTFSTQIGVSTIDGEDTRRGMKISSGTTVNLDHLVIQNGDATTGAGFYDKFGAGIYNEGTLFLDYCEILDNTANYSAGIYVPAGSITLSNSTVDGNTAIYGVGGISITSGDTSTISNSTISSNTAASGAGISTNGTIIIDTSTVSGNYAEEHGGGVSTATGTITITNSTISGNTAIISGGGVRNETGTVTISNTIVARNNSDWGPDCNGTITSGGYNLIGDGENCTFTPTTGDIVNVNPKIAPLADNGGPTMTHALVEGSPAIEGGDDAECNSTDQRGISRPIGDHCDIGAFEGEIPGPAENTFYVKPGGSDSNDCLSPDFACETIDGAIGKAFVYDTVKVATGTYTGSGSDVVSIEIDLTLSGGWNSDFSVQNGMSIIDGQDTRRGVYVVENDIVNIDHFVIQNGYAIEGGGILSKGDVTVDHCEITNNTANGGAGIFVANETLNINHSSISFNNSLGGSGGIFVQNGTTATVENSTINGNSSTSGGGIGVSGGTLIVDTSTVSGNTAGGGAGIGQLNGTVTITNSTISDNTATVVGGGVRNEGGSNTISNTIIAGNYGTAPDCSGDEITSSGYNLIGDTSECTFTPSTGDITNVDPRLNPLNDNGGLTLTHSLITGGPAVDSGNDAVCGSTDQRGVSRPVGAHCDIGAFEGEEPSYINDDLIDAFEIVSLPYINSQDTSFATLEAGEPDFVCAQGDHSVWYKFTPASDGFYDVDLTGSGYDTVVHIYENMGGGVYAPLACNDDFSSVHSRSIFRGFTGTEYYIGVTEHQDGVSGTDDLLISVSSYSCPAGTICATVFDHDGWPLLYPDLHVYDSGGMKVSYTNSVMGGYVESLAVGAGTYDVDFTGEGTFISKTGLGTGYRTASAKHLPAYVIRAKDRFGAETIDGEVWLRKGESNDWMGYFLEGEGLTVYATPGTYDVFIKDWWDVDYALLKADRAFVSGGGAVTLNASTLPLDTITYTWDGATYGYAIISVFDSYISYLGYYPSGYPVYVSLPDASYSLGAEPRLTDGDDVWYYSFYDCCSVVGPGASVAYTIGGTLTTDLSVLGDPYYEGGTGSLETTVMDAYGHRLGAIDLDDDDGILSMSFHSSSDPPGDKVYQGYEDLIDTKPTAVEKTDPISKIDHSMQGSVWYTLFPDYTVEDALSTPIPGALASSYFTAPYEFDIPDPANTGTWSGGVVVEFGPYQADGTDSVTFDVLPSSIDPDNPGFYVPSKYRWYLKTDRTDGWSGVTSFGWGGVSELIPVVGDWDGDGVDTAAFYKPSQWRWYLKNDFTDGWAGVTNFQWGGSAEMIPIAGDWDGDGDDTVGFYKPSTSEWYLKDDNTGGWTGFTKVVWGGASGNIPIVGDWDGDGYDTIGFFVPSANRWWLKNDLADGWAGVTGFTFGTADPMDPVVGDWDGDGTDTVGGYVAAKWRWFLKDDLVTGWSNVSNLKFGVTAGYEVLAGDWE